jgi:hypothetical protein
MAAASAGGWRLGKQGNFVGVGVFHGRGRTHRPAVDEKVLPRPQANKRPWSGRAFLSLASYLSAGPRALFGRIEREKVELAET